MNFIELFKFINKYDLDNEMTFEIHSPGTISDHMKIQEKHLSSPNTAHGTGKFKYSSIDKKGFFP
jgi:hypothetical protein